MKIAVSPFINNNFLFWKKFVKSVEEKLNNKIDFICFNSYAEERNKLNNNYDIYYANPESTLLLYKKGYKPVAKFKNKIDTLYIIGKKDLNKKYIKVATPISSFPIYGVIGFEYEDIEVVFVNSWQKVFEYVKEDKVDAGVIYNEFWKKINDDEVKVIKETNLSLFHTFMVKPEPVSYTHLTLPTIA
jgi:ABC-type amino acid transport substrate-binding protein